MLKAIIGYVPSINSLLLLLKWMLVEIEADILERIRRFREQSEIMNGAD